MSGSRKRRIHWVSDIPTPYRLHLLNALHKATASGNIELSVFFMAQTVSYRKWKIRPEEMKFNCRIVPGVHWGTNTVFHFNPGIVWEVLKQPPDWLIVGGTWWMPTTVASMLAAQRDTSCKVLLYQEA